MVKDYYARLLSGSLPGSCQMRIRDLAGMSSDEEVMHFINCFDMIALDTNHKLRAAA
jgi:hypothetical protein